MMGLKIYGHATACRTCFGGSAITRKMVNHASRPAMQQAPVGRDPCVAGSHHAAFHIGRACLLELGADAA